MKKILSILAVTVLLTSCTMEDTETTTVTTDSTSVVVDSVTTVVDTIDPESVGCGLNPATDTEDTVVSTVTE